MIRLAGGLDHDKYWTAVGETADDRLVDCGFGEWVVTLRPLTADDRPPPAADEPEPLISISAATKTLEIAVRGRPELPPQSFVQASIIDVIDQLIGGRADASVEDLLRDEGGEA